jgi:hypothetical protein
MNNADEMERTAAFRASARFPSPQRLAAGRKRLLAAAAAGQSHPQGLQPARLWLARLWLARLRLARLRLARLRLARLRLARLRALAGPRRRALLAASAAAPLVLIGGIGYGVSTALTGPAPATAGSGAKSAAFTAVSGCAGLKQARGTLAQVTGTSLVIDTARGQPVTVTTTPSTRANLFAAPLTDITDGTSVTVIGPSSNGTIAADRVSVGKFPQAAATFRLHAPAGSKVHTPPGTVAVHGTVSDVSAAGFTLITPDGTQVRVTTSSATDVVVAHASLSQLQTGATTIAYGYAGPDGTLSAVAVLQGLGGQLSVHGCSPASIDNAITTALVSGG